MKVEVEWQDSETKTVEKFSEFLTRTKERALLVRELKV